MNDATQDVIAFLNHPELDLGASPLDIEIVCNPALLRERVETLLEQTNGDGSPISGEDVPALHRRLDEVDWNRVAGEFKERLRLVGVVFDADAKEAFH